jgi:alkyl hydroperoxide reductase subunit AhpC
MEENFFVSTTKVGQKVENFKAQAVLANGEFGEVSLEQNMKAGKWTILFFYPLDFTFVCPTELTALSQAYDKFVAEDAEIFGISTDSVHSHKAWRNLDVSQGGIGELKYPLLQDTNHELSEQFGVLIEEEGISLRGLFIISPEGILENSTINNNNVGRSVDEILRNLAAFKSGGLCPMNWNTGDKNL